MEVYYSTTPKMRGRKRYCGVVGAGGMVVLFLGRFGLGVRGG